MKLYKIIFSSVFCFLHSIYALSINKNVEAPKYSKSTMAYNQSSNDLIIRLLLYDINAVPLVNSAIDGMVLVYGETSSNCADFSDGSKLFNPAENIFMVTDGNFLSFQFRETPTTNLNEVEDIHLFNLSDNQYKFYVQFLEDQGLSKFSNGVFIWDRYLDTYTSVADGSEINFSIDYSIPASYSQTRFAFVFSNPPNKNDNVFNAQEIDVNVACLPDAYSLVNATPQVAEPSSGFSDGINQSVWFKFNAPSSGSVSISTDIPGGSLVDSEIAVYTPGSCSADFSSFVQIGYDDDSGLYNPKSSILNLTGLSAGTTYYIQVDSSKGTGAGTFGIEVRNLFLYNQLSGFSPSNPNGVNAPNAVLFIEDGTVTFTSATTLHHISLGPGAILDLDNDLTADIYIESHNVGSGQIADATGAIITGEVTAERYIPLGKRAYRFLASPVSTSGSINQNWQEGATTAQYNPFPGFGTHISGSAGTVGQVNSSTGFDETSTGNPSLFTFDNTDTGNQDNAWQPINNTNSNTLASGTPYLLLVRGDRSINLSHNSAPHTSTILRAKGALHTGPFSPNLSAVSGYYSLVANPYQSIVDFNSLSFSGDVNPNHMYVFNPNAGTQGLYETLDNATPSEQMIQPGQSFFVRNLSGVTSTPGLTFTESAKNPSGMLTAVFNEDDLAIANLELYNDTGLMMDVLKFRFQSGADNAVNALDAAKYFNPTENLSAQNNGELLSVERRDWPLTQDAIPLFLFNYQSSVYEFRLVQDHWNPEVQIYIQDNYLATQTAIYPGQGYNFSVDQNIPESIAADRFNLIFDKTTLNLDDHSFGTHFRLFPNPTTNGQFSIKTPDLSGEVNVEISNLLGQNVYKQKLSAEGQQVNVNIENLLSGVYLVKLTQDNQSFSTKLMVE